MKKGILAVLALAAIIALSVTAYAGWGMGYGPGGSQCQGNRGISGGPGQGRMMGYGHGSGYMMGNLTDDEVKKINDERDAFFKATEDLRQEIYAKEMELNSELAKKNIDTEKAAKLQKDISKLESEFDQKRLDHMIKMKKINPNMARGFGMLGGYHGGQCGR